MKTYKRINSFFKKLVDLGYYGQDISLKISLFEYGLLGKFDEEKEQYDFIYKHFDSYSQVSLSLKEIKDFINMTWVNKQALFTYVGLDEETFIDQDPLYIISDLISYYGIDNIFGSGYYISLKQLIKNWEE